MAEFTFSVEDLMSNDTSNSAAKNPFLRESMKGVGKPMNTSGSLNKSNFDGYTSLSLTDISSVLQGTPIYDDSNNVLATQNVLLGNLLATTIPKTSQSKAGLGVFDVNIPADITTAVGARNATSLNQPDIKAGTGTGSTTTGTTPVGSGVASTMYDSVNWQAIPQNAPIVAGYVDGSYAWPPQAWARFSGIKLKITVAGQANCDIADCEPGDLTPQGAANWAKAEVAAGRTPTIYSGKSDHSSLVPLLAGVQWNWWAADPTGVDHIVPGSVATQWLWHGDYDQSSTTAGWPAGAVASPAPVTSPGTPGTPTSNRALGQQLVAAAGWTGAEWTAFDNIATHESGWSNTAKNPSSGAYGIAQALPATKYPSAGQPSGGSDAATQINWMIGYIQQRYGDPVQAWAHWQANHWY